nr:retrotransposon protein Ty1-copia subclass [Tanacetum cinerariifolium]
EYLENSSNTITPVLPTEEPDNSLSIGDEYLSNILETKSDEVIKYNVENLVPILSEFEVTSNNEKESNSDIFDATIESLSPSPIFVEDSDSQMEEIDLFLAMDDLMPPGLPKMKFERDHLCFACEQGKIHRKHHKSKMAFASNKPLYLLHMDFCRPMHVQNINGKRYVLVVIDDYSRYTLVFFLRSKDKASEVIISFIKKTQGNLQLQVQRVQADNGT